MPTDPKPTPDDHPPAAAGDDQPDPWEELAEQARRDAPDPEEELRRFFEELPDPPGQSQ